MEITKNEIERLFPSVYITLVSILLGFAVEDVVTRLRELAPFDPFTFLAAAGILAAIMAGWIGYSFSSMTQERLPRVWDAVHVFFLAFGFYILISALGMENYWFLFAVSVHHIFGTVATIYNGNILSRSLSHAYGWRVFQWNAVITVTGCVIFALAGWMSMQGILSNSIEISLVVYFAVSNIAWIYFLKKGWSSLIAHLD